MASNTPKTDRPDRDRRVRQADRLARILSVLQLIQSRGRWNARSIADKLEVTERTVYRDLQALQFAGVPFYFEEADQSYRVRSDYRFTVPALTDDELVGQAVSAVITRATGLTEAGSSSGATDKLAAVLSQESKQLLADVERVVEVLGLPISDQSSAAGFFKVIQQALLAGRQLSGTYASPYCSDSVQLELSPIRLVLIKNSWYLIANSHNQPARTYRVARFERLELSESRAEIPERFDLKAYLGNAWAVFRGDESYDVKIQFLPRVARIVQETRWHHSQSSHRLPDGSVVLEFRVDGLEEICNWLLSWTGNAQVLEPEELRLKLTERLRAGLALNQSG